MTQLEKLGLFLPNTKQFSSAGRLAREAEGGIGLDGAVLVDLDMDAPAVLGRSEQAHAEGRDEREQMQLRVVHCFRSDA